MNRIPKLFVFVIMILGFLVCFPTFLIADDEYRAATKDEVEKLFSNKTVSFERWGTSKGLTIYVQDDGFISVNDKKIKWKARDGGGFCIGKKGKTKPWGCKRIKIYPDGRIYSRGSRDATSGWVKIE